MLKEHREMLAAGHESYAFWGRGRAGETEGEWNFGSQLGVYADAAFTRMDGKAGFHSKAATKRLLRRLDEIKPDVVHLHNLHGYYVNIEMLFEWLAASDCKVEWTLHDCWPFTGHCAYFTYVKCAQWQSHCAYDGPCQQLDTYPKTISKASCSWNFDQKKRLFNLVPSQRMKLITPSKWLADLVAKSLLAKYEVEVRHNTVDTSIFKPTQSDFRARYGIGDRFMILGVASPWTERKGLQDFVRLAGDLDNDKFAVVCVGLSKKQIKQVCDRLVSLPRTDSPAQLAEIYTAADVLLNPSCEETFGMNVAEAAACGTGAIVVEGGSCAEVASSEQTEKVCVDLSDLKATVVKLAGGGLAIPMARTSSPKQLAAVYTAADVFFNPTVEDNFPTVNLEAEACGTSVVTYDTGGCRETIEGLGSIAVGRYKDAIAALTRLKRNESERQF